MTKRLLEDSRIEKAKLSDRDEIVSVLGEAFYEDPVIVHGAGKPGFAEPLFDLEFRHLYAGYGHSYILRDAQGQPVGATMWAAPGQAGTNHTALFTMKLLWTILSRTGFSGLKKLLAIGEWLEGHHLKEPHYYLYTIGVLDRFQGKGAGSMLLSHGLEIADKDQMPCYLETSKIENVRLYERHGFEIMDKENAPFDGPAMWFMRRPPKG